VKPDEPIADIVPGFKVSASIYLDSGEGLNIPKTALLEGDGGYYVYVVDQKSGVISKKSISISDVRKGDDVEVKEGLSLGEAVLVAPNENMRDGEKINYTLRQTGSARSGRNGAAGAARTGSGGGPPGGGGPPM